MSVPSSLKVGPFTSNILLKRRYLFFYFFIVWGTLFFIQFELWLYWKLLYHNFRIQFYIFLPLLLFVIYISAVFVSLIIAKILLILVGFIHKPREGVFLRDSSDKDYRYWSIRNTIKKFPIWLSHKFPFPFLDNLCFKMFGVKTKFSNSLFEGYVDTEFIEFGDNVIVGQASIIQSSLIIGKLLIIQKTIIEDNVRIGAHSIIMPGTHIGKNCILVASSTTIVGQELEEGWIYIGVPAKKYKENRFFEDNLEEILDKTEDIDIEKLRKKYEELYLKRHDTNISLLAKVQRKKEILEKEKLRLKIGG